MSLFGGNPFKKILKGFGKLVGGALDFLFGDDDKKDSFEQVKKPKPVEETPIQTPTQKQQTESQAGKSDVGLGDVVSIFDKDEKDPFKRFLQ